MPFVVMTDPEWSDDQRTLTRRPHATMREALRAARRHVYAKDGAVAVVWINANNIPKVWMARVRLGPGRLLATTFTPSGEAQMDAEARR